MRRQGVALPTAVTLIYMFWATAIGAALAFAVGVVRVDSAEGEVGLVTRFAGVGGLGGLDGDGGPALNAHLCQPHGIDVGPDGSVYFADSCNNVIRRVRPDGVIERVAGTGTRGFSGDGGPAVDAQLAYPIDLQVLQDGRVVIGDNSNNRVRIVGTDGVVSTLAELPDNVFSGVAVDESTGTVYAATDHSQIFSISPAGNVSLYAGIASASCPSSPDGTPALEAGLGCVYDIEFSGGELYYVGTNQDNNQSKVRKISKGVLRSVGPPVSFGTTGLEIRGAEFLVSVTSGGVGFVQSVKEGAPAASVIVGMEGSCSDFDSGCPTLSASLNGVGDIAISDSGDAFATELLGNRVHRTEGFRSPSSPADADLVVVFLEGLGSELSQDDISTASACAEGSQDFGEIKKELASRGISCAQMLLFSYNGGSFDEAGRWHPNPYGCGDTQKRLIRSVARGYDLLRLYRARHPTARFVLVGHSLGGKVALELTKLEGRDPALPAGSIAAVVAVDSPLNHASKKNLDDIGKTVPTSVLRFCLGQAFFSPVARELADVTDKNRERIIRQQQDLVSRAQGLGTRVMTVGNAQDCVWYLTLCEVERRRRDNRRVLSGDWIDDRETMTVENADLAKLYELGTQDCEVSNAFEFPCLALPHGIALETSTVVDDIADFVLAD